MGIMFSSRFWQVLTVWSIICLWKTVYVLSLGWYTTERGDLCMPVLIMAVLFYLSVWNVDDCKKREAKNGG